jgi:hypothetical protein
MDLSGGQCRLIIVFRIYCDVLDKLVLRFLRSFCYRYIRKMWTLCELSRYLICQNSFSCVRLCVWVYDCFKVAQYFVGLGITVYTHRDVHLLLLLLLLLLCIFNCNWVDTRWQQYSTHLHTNSTQNTENGTYITIKINKKITLRLCEHLRWE